MKTAIVIIGLDNQALAMDQIQTAIQQQLPPEKRVFTDMENAWICAEADYALSEGGVEAAQAVIRKYLQAALANEEYKKASFLRQLRAYITEKQKVPA